MSIPNTVLESLWLLNASITEPSSPPQAISLDDVTPFSTSEEISQLDPSEPGSLKALISLSSGLFCTMFKKSGAMPIPPLEEQSQLTALHRLVANMDRITQYRLVKSIVEWSITKKGYDARSRLIVRTLCKLMNIPHDDLVEMEIKATDALLFTVEEFERAESQFVSSDTTIQKVNATHSSAPSVWIVIAFTAGTAAACVGLGFLAWPVLTHGLAGVAAMLKISTVSLPHLLPASVVHGAFIAKCGVAGGALGAYRATHRVGGCTEFHFSPIDKDWEKHTKPMLKGKSRKVGLVVPVTFRANVMENIAIHCEHKIKFRLALDNCTGSELVFWKDMFLYGCWHRAPPETIPAGHSGVFLARNGSYRLTGTSGVYAYKIEGTKQVIVCGFNCPLVGDNTFCAFIEDETVDWKSMCDRAQQRWISTPGEFRSPEVQHEVEWFGTDRRVAVLSQVSGDMMLKQALMCSHEQQEQVFNDVKHHISHNRYVAVNIVNDTKSTMTLLKKIVVSGHLAYETPLSPTIPPGETLVLIVENDSFLANANMKIFYKLDNDVLFCMQVTYTGITKAVGGTAEVQQFPLDLEVHQIAGNSPCSADGMFFISWEVDLGTNLVTFRCEELEIMATPIRPNPRLLVCVSGVLTVNDPRAPPREQAGFLWNPIFAVPHPPLNLLGSETYYLQWDSTYQIEFGNVFNVTSDELGEEVAHHAIHEGAEHVVEAVAHAAAHASLGIIGFFKFPRYVYLASTLIDNAYICINNRSIDAGQQLALAIINNFHGNKPISLVVTSSGANVLLTACKDLAAAGKYGVIEDVFVLGGTISSSEETWSLIRSMASGRVVNVYSSGDWFLSFLTRSNGSFRTVSGLCRIQSVPGVENVNVSKLVTTHQAYVSRLALILKEIPTEPTLQTLNPDEESEGITVPIILDMGTACHTIYNAVVARRKLLVCLQNYTSVTMECVGQVVSRGRWEFAPPKEIVPSHAGILCAASKTRGDDGSVLCAISFKLGDDGSDFLIVKISQKGEGAGNELTFTCSVVKAACTLEELLSGNAVVDTLPTSTTFHTDIQCTMNNQLVLVKLVENPERDQKLQGDVDALIQLRHWESPAPWTQQCGLSVEAEQALSTLGGTTSSPEYFPSKLSQSSLSRGLSIVILNRTTNDTHTLVLRKEVLSQGQWQIIPLKETRSNQRIAGGIIPSVTRGCMEGKIELDIRRGDMQGESTRLGTLGISFQRKWCQQREMIVGCVLVESGMEEIGSPALPPPTSVVDDRFSAKCSDVVVVVDVQEARNAIVVVVVNEKVKQ